MALRHGGTHLILPLVKRLTGKPLYRPKGEEALVCVPNGPLIVFLRNPRDWLVASFRWKHRRWPSDAELARFMAAVKPDRRFSPLGFVAAWAERWAVSADDAALLTRFEAFATEATGLAETRRIRDFLGFGDAEAAFRAVWRRGTWTGRRSDWRACFGPRSLAAYRDGGGEGVDRMMGYRND